MHPAPSANLPIAAGIGKSAGSSWYRRKCRCTPERIGENAVAGRTHSCSIGETTVAGSEQGSTTNSALSHNPRALAKRNHRSRELTASKIIDRLGNLQIIDKGELALYAAIIGKPEIYSVILGRMDIFAHLVDSKSPGYAAPQT